MKVLVCTPLHPDYGIRKTSLESIMALNWEHRLTYTFMRSTPYMKSDHYYDILAKVQEARRIALDGDYDALMLIEADIIVPPDALCKMVADKGDVIYGLYCSRSAKHHPWLVFQTLGLDRATVLTKEQKTVLYGTSIDSKGAGFGCTLIYNNVLREIPFRMQTGGMSPDWWFALDVASHGMRQVSNLSVSCGHILDNGDVVWADPTQPTFYRIDEVTK